MDITLGNRSEASKRFNFVRGADGDVSFDDTCAHEVMTALMEDRSTYVFDPNHGSEISTLANLTSRTPSQADAMGYDALRPLEKDNVITKAQVISERERILGQPTGRLLIKAKWTTPSGSEETAQAEV